MTYRWKCRKRVGQLEQMSLFALIVNYWCRTLYCPKQSPNDVVAILNVTPFFLLFFFYFLFIALFFASPANICHINDINGVQRTESRDLGC